MDTPIFVGPDLGDDQSREPALANRELCSGNTNYLSGNGLQVDAALLLTYASRIGRQEGAIELVRHWPLNSAIEPEG